MRSQIVEIAAASCHFGLQSPGHLLAAVVVELARRHRKSYLHGEHLAYLLVLDDGAHLLEVGQIAPVEGHEAGYACQLAYAVDAQAVHVARC